MTPHPFKYHR